MLLELYIENFALIDQMTVTFHRGLNILSGETGAGKSIVIDAINVLLGERAGTDQIRSGTQRALLQATFDVLNSPAIAAIAAELGLETAEDGLLVLTREVAREGRNVARINGRVTPLSVIRQIGDALVDLHGQHEHQSLLREERHLNFLDAMGDDDFQQLANTVSQKARHRRHLLNEIAALQLNERERQRTMELLNFQLEEIESAALQPNEEEELATERSRLTHAEKLHEAATLTYTQLYEGEEGVSVLEAIGEAQMRLANLARYDDTLTAWANALEATAVQISDTCFELVAYRDQLTFDPEKLSEVDDRLTVINNLKRKYGASIEEVLAYCEEQRAELHRLQHNEESRDELLLELSRLEDKLAVEALQLSEQRKVIARQLSQDIQLELAQLGMPKAQFLVNITRHPAENGLLVAGEKVQISSTGIDIVTFDISANDGEPAKPLAKVASGGELSRIMLALKAVAARGSEIPTLIFDEIDTGIGGRTAEAVGMKLLQVARFAQVISVTHLAQIAFYADQHFLIEKNTREGRTSSTMRALSEDERMNELARLQAGTRVTEAVLTHVREVAEDIKEQKEKACQ